MVISAELDLPTPPPLEFPYTKDSGTEIYVSTTGSDVSGDGSIGNPYQTIQSGINAASNGNIVTVLPGTYTGSVILKFHLKANKSQFQSEDGPLFTTIDCEFNGRGFLVNQGESMNTVIKGFEIMNGKKYAASVTSNCCQCIFVEDNSGILIKDCFFETIKRDALCLVTLRQVAPKSAIENCFFKNNLGQCVYSGKKSFIRG